MPDQQNFGYLAQLTDFIRSGVGSFTVVIQWIEEKEEESIQRHKGGISYEGLSDLQEPVKFFLSTDYWEVMNMPHSIDFQQELQATDWVLEIGVNEEKSKKFT